MATTATKIKILSTNISKEKGTIKHPRGSITLSGIGVEGDAHSGSWHRQVSLLAKESIEGFAHKAGRVIQYGEFAENITTEGLLLHHCHPLDRFKNEDIELEVTQIGKECHGDDCAIFREVGNCVMPKEGVFARTINGGVLKPGDELEYIPRAVRIHIITLSDRASRGEYTDRSGPHIRHLSKKFFNEKNRPFETEITLIPDDAGKLIHIIKKQVRKGVDVIFTTGGTGIGPNDITPDTVQPMLEKEITGVMEMIRVKYGANKPNALLSRGISGTIGKTLVYTLPGSVKAVTEYLEVILPTIGHSILMLHGLGH
ncbi:FIG060329: MOSC domain protein [hydrothermal vent metagenome]|uniref:FIG060329: MOSC domain protein n=1 Tax=hydrothermal vent metagenome TaxID=652676 RepID=A0A3B0UDJ4_9ZZZZ